MRKLITGVDTDGRSCLLDVIEVTPVRVEGHGVDVERIYATTESPPRGGAPAAGRNVDVGLAPGLLRWLVVEHPPESERRGPTTAGTIHHADTLDLVFVHEGGGELMLQDGAHPVGAGDLIVMPGVDHAMKPGPDGCRIVVVSVGTAPPSEAS
jgi:hypothetical protein